MSYYSYIGTPSHSIFKSVAASTSRRRQAHELLSNTQYNDQDSISPNYLAWNAEDALPSRYSFPFNSEDIHRDISVANYKRMTQSNDSLKIPEATIKDIPEATIKDIPEATIKDIPEATIKDIPEATIKDIPEATIKDIPDIENNFKIVMPESLQLVWNDLSEMQKIQILYQSLISHMKANQNHKAIRSSSHQQDQETPRNIGYDIELKSEKLFNSMMKDLICGKIFAKFEKYEAIQDKQNNQNKKNKKKENISEYVEIIEYMGPTNGDLKRSSVLKTYINQNKNCFIEKITVFKGTKSRIWITIRVHIIDTLLQKNKISLLLTDFKQKFGSFVIGEKFWVFPIKNSSDVVYVLNMIKRYEQIYPSIITNNIYKIFNIDDKMKTFGIQYDSRVEDNVSLSDLFDVAFKISNFINNGKYSSTESHKFSRSRILQEPSTDDDSIMRGFMRQ